MLTSWNALMIAGLAKAAKVYNAPEYLEMARAAAEFIENKLIQDGRIMVRYRDGEVKIKDLSMTTPSCCGPTSNCMKHHLI
ncbi:hypothetical protein PO124_30770 [Bacillus licheniformis]|nr:hypothetical protein [Bacillus licheniformis]